MFCFLFRSKASSPNGIDVCNGSMPISNGKLHDADVMKPSGSPTGSRSPYMETSPGVYDEVRDSVDKENLLVFCVIIPSIDFIY